MLFCRSNTPVKSLAGHFSSFFHNLTQEKLLWKDSSVTQCWMKFPSSENTHAICSLALVHEIWFDYLIWDKGHMTHCISAIVNINGGKCVCVVSRPTCCFIYLFCSKLVMSYRATSWTLGSFTPSAPVRAQTSCRLATGEPLQDAYLSERQRAVKSQRATWADAIKGAKFCTFLLRFNDWNIKQASAVSRWRCSELTETIND